MEDKSKLAMAAAGVTCAALAAFSLLGKGKSAASQESAAQESAAKSESQTDQADRPDQIVALIGDVGGTNVRLTLRKLCLSTRTSTEIKPLTKIPSQSVESFSAALQIFLSEFEKGSESWPSVGVVGIAGEVKNNVVCTTNCKHWSPTDGKALAQEYGMTDFQLINDFVAAGHGLLQLQEKDYTRLNRCEPEKGGVKVVLGPGTGHGQGFLVKSRFAPCYEVYPAEGGHCEFAPRNDQDMRLVNFAYDYIENSKNVENRRADGKISRISHERLGAGPAVPLIYEFLKNEYPDLPRIFETGENAKTPDEIDCHDVISSAMEKKDPLCMKVVEKFSEIFAVEAGDAALKYLPYGGVYLIGGVTMAIRDYILHDKAWINTFYAKGRLESTMRRIPVMMLDPSTELGILGAEEVAYRLSGSFELPSTPQ